MKTFVGRGAAEHCALFGGTVDRDVQLGVLGCGDDEEVADEIVRRVLA